MDITKTVEPRSDQLNFDDVATKSVTVTVVEVKKGTTEQPVEIHTAEYPGRPYKPGKSMRRVLVAAWGAEASVYVGRRITLYGDPTVRFGKDTVGGIRISHLSHIPEPLSVNLTVTRGKRAPFVVNPLPEESGRDWLGALDLAGDDVDAVTALGMAARGAGASGDVLTAIRDRYKELTEVEPTDEPR